MASNLRIVLNAHIRDTDPPEDIELNYEFTGLRCFQPIPRKAIGWYMDGYSKRDAGDAGFLTLSLVEGFSIEINTGPTAIAFNEIQFKHLTDHSLNFELPMGLVKRIYDLEDKIDLRFRFPEEPRQ